MENWPVYFAQRLKRVTSTSAVYSKRSVYRLRNGIKYDARCSDVGIIEEVWHDRLYTPKGFEIGESDVVVDIGTQIGIFSIFASVFAKHGRVYSFEPAPENFEMLIRNIQINKVGNIYPINKAVSDRSGKKKLFLSKDNGGGHSFYKACVAGSVNDETIVETISFGEFIEKSLVSGVDFLKMDCEGAEYEILFGCPERILRRISKISMEYHNLDEGRNATALMRFLENKGFEVRVNEINDAVGTIYAKNRLLSNSPAKVT